MLGKKSLILPAWRPAGSHASRHAPWTSYVHRGRFKSLSASKAQGKLGTTLHDTPRSVDSIEAPATEMVLDLKQIVSTHIVEVDTHTLDTAVERVEPSTEDHAALSAVRVGTGIA